MSLTITPQSLSFIPPWFINVINFMYAVWWVCREKNFQCNQNCPMQS